MSINQRLTTFLLCAYLVLMPLCGCDDKIADNNSKDEKSEVITSPATMPLSEPYSKIKVGMKYSEVFNLLRKPLSERGSGTSILTYAISPTEELTLQTTGTGDNSVVINIAYKRTKK